MRAIRIESLRIAFHGKTLLHDFSLTLASGRRLTITGPSGSGKSSLLKCLLGFLRPAGGAIEIMGMTLDAASVWRIRRNVAWVAQEPDLGDGTARQALERPFSYRSNRPLAANLARVGELAERFLLDPELLDRPVAKLSGGEKQRVAILSALLLDRPVLLLDEASSALDAASRSAVAEYLAGQTAVAILSVSHNPENLRLGGPVMEIRPPGGA